LIENNGIENLGERYVTYLVTYVT